MAATNPKFIGDLTLNAFHGYISAAASGSKNKMLTERIVKLAGLTSSSDPFEKIFSSFTSHIETYGATEEMEKKVEAISRVYKDIEDAPHSIKEYVRGVTTGKEMHRASSGAPVSKLKVSPKTAPEPKSTPVLHSLAPEKKPKPILEVGEKKSFGAKTKAIESAVEEISEVALPTTTAAPIKAAVVATSAPVSAAASKTVASHVPAKATRTMMNSSKNIAEQVTKGSRRIYRTARCRSCSGYWWNISY